MNKPEELQKRIDDYFKNTTPEQLLKDLEECGLGEIKSWEELGIKLINK
jgi:hypothetical protein